MSHRHEIGPRGEYGWKRLDFDDGNHGPFREDGPFWVGTSGSESYLWETGKAIYIWESGVVRIARPERSGMLFDLEPDGAPETDPILNMIENIGDRMRIRLIKDQI